jgi:hypothetical protein
MTARFAPGRGSLMISSEVRIQGPVGEALVYFSLTFVV